MSDSKKLAFFLPNAFTALNIGCGFLAIIFASQGLFYRASMVILLGAIFDLVDGRVARLTGTQSSFGEQFDSLSDLVSFGLAPSLIFYFRFLQDQGRLGIICTFIFLQVPLSAFISEIGVIIALMFFDSLLQEYS